MNAHPVLEYILKAYMPCLWYLNFTWKWGPLVITSSKSCLDFKRTSLTFNCFQNWNESIKDDKNMFR